MKKYLLSALCGLVLLPMTLIGQSATFSWDYDYAGQDPAAITFQIYKTSSETTDPEVLVPLTNTTLLEYTDSNVTVGTTYTYSITALKTENGVLIESDYSNLLVVAIIENSQISFVKLNKNKVTVEWSQVGTGVTYSVQHAITLNGESLNTNFVELGSVVDSNTGTYNISQLNKGDIISLKIVSDNGSTTSESSVINVSYNPPTNLVTQ